MHRPAVLIFNPAAGRQRAAETVNQILDLLAAEGWQGEPQPTAAAGHATELAAAAVEEGAEAVFAFGGDGTLREVAKGLLGSTVPLGPLPGGTTNVLVRALGIPRQPLAAARIVARSKATPMDVGLCLGEPFLMMVSAGLDAQVLRHQSPRWKARLGAIAVPLAGLRQWWSYHYPELRVEADGEELSGTLMVASNIPLYSGDFRMAPGARIDDGYLDLVVFQGQGRLPTLSFAWSLLRTRHIHRHDVVLRRVKEVRFLAPEDPAVQVDGDPLVETHPPFSVGVAKDRLWVLKPDTLPDL